MRHHYYARLAFLYAFVFTAAFANDDDRTFMWKKKAIKSIKCRERPRPKTSSPHSTTTTGFPNTSIFGRTPNPNSRDAASRPFTRCGAPSAVLTVT